MRQGRVTAKDESDLVLAMRQRAANEAIFRQKLKAATSSVERSEEIKKILDASRRARRMNIKVPPKLTEEVEREAKTVYSDECPACEGRGLVGHPDDPAGTCSHCGGTGAIIHGRTKIKPRKTVPAPKPAPESEPEEHVSNPLWARF